jgi:CheY-like chemotaxis protein
MDDAFKILLAEDNEDDAVLFERAVRAVPNAHLVWHAHDGDEAINYLEGTRIFSDRKEHPFPDVLVLDLKMPNRNGFEVLEWLGGRFPRLKVGVFSSSDLPEDISRAQVLGAHLYQAKTINPEVMQHFLQSLGRLALSDKTESM